MSVTLETTSTQRATSAPPLAGGVLLASHGGSASEAAARLACMFADARHVPMEVLGVVEPLPADIRDYAPDVDRLMDDYRQRLSETLNEFLGRVPIPPGVHIAVTEGEPAEEIAARARKRGAALIAVGIGRYEHQTADRLLGVEIATKILRRTTIPVLAAASNTPTPLSTIVIATDFSPASQRAAQLAIACAADNAIVHLVHVWPWMGQIKTNAATQRRVYEAGTRRLCDELIATFPKHRVGCVITHLRQGEPESAIRDLAREEHADLIALGSHGRAFLDRLTLGSVAEAILRTARCAVLVAPPTPAEKAS